MTHRLRRAGALLGASLAAVGLTACGGGAARAPKAREGVGQSAFERRLEG